MTGGEITSFSLVIWGIKVFLDWLWQRTRYIINHPKLTTAQIMALSNDVLDYYGLGAIPVSGDVFDILVSGSFHFVGFLKLALVSLVELYPGVDFLPVHTIIVGLITLQVDSREAINRFR